MKKKKTHTSNVSIVLQGTTTDDVYVRYDDNEQYERRNILPTHQPQPWRSSSRHMLDVIRKPTITLTGEFKWVSKTEESNEFFVKYRQVLFMISTENFATLLDTPLACAVA